MDDYKRSHIPAFGNWDYEDGLPITQYFESARQAGLLRYTYGEGDLYSYSAATGYYDHHHDNDLYLKPTTTTTTIAVVPRRKIKGSENDDYSSYVKEQKKQGRVHDMTLTSSTQQVQIAPKAIDEDLYKIPPELLYTNPKKRKTFGGFFSRCLMPVCAA